VREWAYTERGVERLISLIDPKNTRSIRVADKLGAVPDELVATVYGPLLTWLHPRP
jgi:RimJ/RimL family protein N-acetyltransferase